MVSHDHDAHELGLSWLNCLLKDGSSSDGRSKPIFCAQWVLKHIQDDEVVL